MKLLQLLKRKFYKKIKHIEHLKTSTKPVPKEILYSLIMPRKILLKSEEDKLSMRSLLWSKISSNKKKRKNTSERASKVEISSEQFKIWFKNNYDGTCYYCGVSIEQYRASKFLKKIRPHIKNFGIDRKDTKEGYSINNIAVCCIFCNSVKGSFFNDKEFKEIGKKYIRKLYD